MKTDKISTQIISKIILHSKNLHSMNTTNVSHKMTYLKTAITACFFIAFSAFLVAQSTPSRLLAANDLSPKGIVESEWSFFYDAENEIYYIDFETISLNLTKVKVVAKDGKAIISDDVVDLPVNTIYELDCSNLAKGNYTVELHSYTEVLTKEVTLK